MSRVDGCYGACVGLPQQKPREARSPVAGYRLGGPVQKILGPKSQAGPSAINATRGHRIKAIAGWGCCSRPSGRAVPAFRLPPAGRDRFVTWLARGFRRTFPAPLSRQLYEDLCIAEELPSADHEAAAASCDHPSRSGDAFPPGAKRAVLSGIRGNLRQTRTARICVANFGVDEPAVLKATAAALLNRIECVVKKSPAKSMRRRAPAEARRRHASP